MIDPPYVRYISPTSLNLFETNLGKFIIFYIKGIKRPPQTDPMAIGSGFDARVKGQLEADLLGKPNRWEELFHSQVDSNLWDHILVASNAVMGDYLASGAYASLVKELAGFQNEPQFEFDAARTIDVEYDGVPMSIPLFGKADLFATLEDCNVVYDWKVNGYYGVGQVMPGYISLRDSHGHDRGCHKNAFVVFENGVKHNILDQLKADWKAQLWFYQTMIKVDNDLPWIVGIDQLVYTHSHLKGVATHRTSLSGEYCDSMLQRVCSMWKQLNDGLEIPQLEESAITINTTDPRRMRLFNMPQ